jgi:hypothetical protein
MVERYRPHITPSQPAPAPAPAPAPKLSRNTNATQAVFVCLPNAVLKRPPIRHRDEPSDSGLSALEFAVAVACVTLARVDVVTASRKHALLAGKAAMRLARKEPIRDRHVLSASEQFAAAGQDGYARGLTEFRQNAPDEDYVVEVSMRKLFRKAGPQRTSRNATRLPGVLRRLTRPIGDFAPVLRRWKRLPSRKLRLVVNGAWVPRQKFGRVPWPPPLAGGGATVLSLYLFVFGADLRPRSRTAIRVETLCYKKLGIPRSSPAHARRALDRALAAVNAHLRPLRTALAEFDIPAAFNIAETRGGRFVRFAKAKTKRDALRNSADEDVPDELESEVVEARNRKRWQDDPFARMVMRASKQ